MKTESLKKILNEIQAEADRETGSHIIAEIYIRSSNFCLVMLELHKDKWKFMDDDDILFVENEHGKHFLNVADVVRVSI